MFSTVTPDRETSKDLDEALIASTNSARVIAPMVLEITKAASIVEYGCGAGDWLSVFKDLGISDCLGIDSPRRKNGTLKINQNELATHDLTQRLSLDRKFDLAVCTKLAETLPQSCAEQLIENLTDLSCMVLFAAEIPHQGNPKNLNSQWPEYWAARFASRGYTAVDCFRIPVWQNEDVEPYYSQNLLLFVRQDALRKNPKLQELAKETNPQRLTLIHPKTYVKNFYSATEPRILFVRMVWNAIPTGIRRTLVKPMREFFWKLFAR